MGQLSASSADEAEEARRNDAGLSTEPQSPQNYLKGISHIYSNEPVPDSDCDHFEAECVSAEAEERERHPGRVTLLSAVCRNCSGVFCRRDYAAGDTFTIPSVLWAPLWIWDFHRRNLHKHWHHSPDVPPGQGKGGVIDSLEWRKKHRR